MKKKNNTLKAYLQNTAVSQTSFLKTVKNISV